jgi:hypothetical protein
MYENNSTDYNLRRTRPPLSLRSNHYHARDVGLLSERNLQSMGCCRQRQDQAVKCQLKPSSDSLEDEKSVPQGGGSTGR